MKRSDIRKCRLPAAVAAALLLALWAIGMCLVQNAAGQSDGEDGSAAAAQSVAGTGLFDTEDVPGITYAETQTRAEQPEADEEENHATSHKNDVPPAEPVSDAYAQAYSLVRLRCHYPEGESYVWEVRNDLTDTWQIPADSVDVHTDELGRDLSVLSVRTGAEDLSVRCTVLTTEGETLTDEAVIHIIPEIAAIEAEDYTADAGTRISAKDVPLIISHADGTRETVTGLCGVTFIERREDREYSVDENGHTVETVTTVNTEYEYVYVSPGDREFYLRYRAGDREFETKLTVSGKDTAPVISVSLQNADTEWRESNRILVSAEDYTTVEYRFINGGEDSGWTDRNEYEVFCNGTWEIQVRDEAGNVASDTITVGNIDSQKPVIEKIAVIEKEGENEKNEEN
ncbi:MAG: hypothetical protein NC337_05495 [Roseburia sp.]|nr:hypothetical protein [Roseburia sp.]